VSRPDLKLCIGLIAILAIFGTGASQAASSSKFAGTCIDVSLGNMSWDNIAQLQGPSNDVPATVELSKPKFPLSFFAQCTGFGFAIPLGSRIDSITVTIRGYASVADAVYASSVSSLKPGTSFSTGAYWGTTYANHLFGPSLFNTPWTAAEINDSGFGFRFRAEYFNGPEGVPVTAVADSMEVTVVYSVGPPTISKQFGASSIPVNTSTTLGITVTNPNAAAALTGIAFSDTLPEGLLVATPNGLTNTCGGTATAAAGGGSLSLTGGTLAATESCTIQITVTGTTLGVKPNTTSTVTSTEGGAGTTSNTAILTVFLPELIYENGFE
jgi:hypothetical protein